jgi:lipid II isoglutaminyl synthase (glutamine-hydrolysing)
MTSLRDRAALLAGRGAGASARRLGRGGGTALPGLVAGAIASDLVRSLAESLPQGVVTVTGTNGKTTTAHLLSAILTEAGFEPLANRSGSNLERGLLATYVDAAGASGGASEGEQGIGVLEVDEAELPRLFPRLRPRVATFLNLFRDQLDRYGEVDSVAEGWHAMLADLEGGTTLVLNADDPNVAELASRAPGRVVHFGLDDHSVALDAADHASDARFCPEGNRFEYDAIYMGHVGDWHCDCCGRSRPAPDVVAREVELSDEGSRVSIAIGETLFVVDLPLPGLYIVYNALAAAATAHALGVDADSIARALGAATAPFGRQERFQLDGREARVLLAKNPAGLNEVIRTLAASERPLTILAMLNDGIQDGQDVSWIYDADLELLAGRELHLVCAGDRADDFALRWMLAGIEPRSVVTATEAALDVALAATPEGARLDVIATYTAMLDVREALARRAGTASYWETPSEGGGR